MFSISKEFMAYRKGIVMLTARNSCASIYISALYRKPVVPFIAYIPACKKFLALECRYISGNANGQHITVNPKEVEKFQILSDEWWKNNGQFSLLHSMNNLRIPFIRDGILNTMIGKVEKQPKPLKNIHILDVGCGGGILSEPLARLGAFVTGVDPGTENINVAKYHAEQDREIKDLITYVCGTVEDLSKKEKKYDAVVCSEVIEHVDNVEMFVKCCVDLLTENGSVFFTTINRTFLSYWVAIVAAERVFKKLPLGTHEWEKFVNPLDLQIMLKLYSCRTQLVHGMLYNPLTKNWSWSQIDSVNYALHAVKDRF